MVGYSGEKPIDMVSVVQSYGWREREKIYFSFVSIVH